MPIVVEVKSKDDYAKWSDQQKTLLAAAAADPNKVWERGELVTRGAIIYAANCAACHQASGKGVPGTFPALDASKVVNGPKDAQIAIVLNGKPGSAMPPWTQLSDIDLAAAITYTRNSWSNKTGEAVQPSDIKAGRK